MDLNGYRVIAVSEKASGRGVLCDVDNGGFAQETGWIGSITPEKIA